VSPPLPLAAVVCGLLVVSAGAAAFVRYPVVLPIALLAAAPFRISVSIGSQKAYLLLPLYAVLASAMLALLVRALRTREARHLPALLAVPGAAFVLLAGVSLTWTKDLRQGTI